MDQLRGVVYIAGAARSGSTLLGLLLSQLHGVSSAGELRWLWDRDIPPRCRLGDDLVDCPVFGPAVRANTQGAAPSSLPDRPDVVRSVVELLARTTRSAWLVDASKSPSQLRRLRDAGMETRVIHLVRDPRAVIYSHVRRDGMGLSRRPIRTQVANWAAKAAVFEPRTWTDRGVLMRYEDLAHDPHAALSSLATWLGVPAPTDWGATIEVAAPHSLYGNGRVDHTATTIEVREDDAWRHDLDAGTRRLVTVATAPWLLRFGYPLRPSSTRA